VGYQQPYSPCHKPFHLTVHQCPPEFNPYSVMTKKTEAAFNSVEMLFSFPLSYSSRKGQHVRIKKLLFNSISHCIMLPLFLLPPPPLRKGKKIF